MTPQKTYQKLEDLLTRDFSKLFLQGRLHLSRIESRYGIDSGLAKIWTDRLLRIQSFLFLHGIEIDWTPPGALAETQGENS